MSGALPRFFNLNNFAKEVWSIERINELKGENLSVIIYISETGKFEEMIFFLNQETKITLKEITLLEKKLKNANIELQYNNLEGAGYTPLLYRISFSKLIQ
ncbi:MAG: hypothetical protein LUG18_09935 [Candidatus Azobacteroides sp.]|nr:hypothetical protein [Candidatus Azobacteroides sp.]